MSYSFGRARSIKVRSHSMPNFSTFAHCAAVSRIERCSSFALGGAGGRPRGRFSCSMPASVNHLLNHKKSLAQDYLLNHNKCTDKRNRERTMANFKYFSDIDGEAVQLKAPYGMDNKEFAVKFPGVKGFRYDGYSMWVGYPMEGTGGPLPITRKIEFKAYPSRHECNAKCLNGKVNGACECQCGGKNHGAGMFQRLLEVA